jgi:hypothetical protein
LSILIIHYIKAISVYYSKCNLLSTIHALYMEVRFAGIILPALLNNLSLVADVACTAKYFHANSDKIRNSFLCISKAPNGSDQNPEPIQNQSKIRFGSVRFLEPKTGGSVRIDPIDASRHLVIVQGRNLAC